VGTRELPEDLAQLAALGDVAEERKAEEVAHPLEAEGLPLEGRDALEAGDLRVCLGETGLDGGRVESGAEREDAGVDANVPLIVVYGEIDRGERGVGGAAPVEPALHLPAVAFGV